MAQKLTASMPADLDLPASWIVRLTAVDPNSGALVSGVNVSGVAIIADALTPATTDTAPTLVPIPPVWLPEDLSSQEGGEPGSTGG